MRETFPRLNNKAMGDNGKLSPCAANKNGKACVAFGTVIGDMSAKQFLNKCDTQHMTKQCDALFDYEADQGSGYTINTVSDKVELKLRGHRTTYLI